jgi:hypothetical protein
MNILTVNLIFSTVVFWIAASIYVFPKIPEVAPQTILLPILLLHSLRHLGLMFLSPGAIYDGMPAEFAYPAALGDFLAACLALLCILALTRHLRFARPLLWIFTVVGSVDLMVAITLATMYGAGDFMGPAYWIPAFWVPALIVTHVIAAVVLWKGRTLPA